MAPTWQNSVALQLGAVWFLGHVDGSSGLSVFYLRSADDRYLVAQELGDTFRVGLWVPAEPRRAGTYWNLPHPRLPVWDLSVSPNVPLCCNTRINQSVWENWVDSVAKRGRVTFASALNRRRDCS